MVYGTLVITAPNSSAFLEAFNDELPYVVNGYICGFGKLKPSGSGGCSYSNIESSTMYAVCQDQPGWCSTIPKNGTITYASYSFNLSPVLMQESPDNLVPITFGGGCACGCNSFSPSTRVLLAGGATKAIKDGLEQVAIAGRRLTRIS